MGRFLRKLKKRINDHKASLIQDQESAQRAFEDQKPDAMRADIRMISGCEDHQTSADVSNVHAFQLPDPAGRAGGACTSTLLRILYKDETVPETKLSFTEVLEEMRVQLSRGGYTQIPQLTASNPIDMNTDFDLVPPSATGTHRAVMIGINYVGHNPGELSGCHNDVLNMKKYIMNVHGFDEENITVLMDDGEHPMPTRANIMAAYKKVVAESEDGDAIFLHFSGHGTKLADDNGDEDDGYDEALVPVDFQEGADMIRDDVLYDTIIKPLPKGVHVVSLMDCCHSGTILDLPYIFRADGSAHPNGGMQLNESVDLDALIQQFGGQAIGFLKQFLAA